MSFAPNPQVLQSEIGAGLRQVTKSPAWSARALFAELTPARLDLLDTLRRVGPCSVYALAKAAARNYSNVHADVARLEELGLVERTDELAVWVPYSAIEIKVPLARAVA